MMTPKKVLFAKEYLVDLNATRAAIRAGYSAHTARSQGQRLLTDVDVQAAIQEAMKARSKRVEISADRVLQEVSRLAFFDPRKLFDASGFLRPINEWDDDTAAAVENITNREIFDGSGDQRSIIGIQKSVTVSNKPKALELLGKHLGIWESDSGDETHPTPVAVTVNVVDGRKA